MEIPVDKCFLYASSWCGRKTIKKLKSARGLAPKVPGEILRLGDFCVTTYTSQQTNYPVCFLLVRFIDRNNSTFHDDFYI